MQSNNDPSRLKAASNGFFVACQALAWYFLLLWLSHGLFAPDHRADRLENHDFATHIVLMVKVSDTASNSKKALPSARFSLGDVVRHRSYGFRGVVFDVDPEFSNSEEWYEAIPEQLRPAREQPYYHLFAENEESSYIAYVSQQNLVPDSDAGPVDHPAISQLFGELDGGRYRLRASRLN